MGEHQRRPPNDPPKQKPLAHQITEVSVTLRAGHQIQTFCIDSKQTLKENFNSARQVNGEFIVRSGSKSEEYENSDIIFPADDILILAIADVIQPSNIIKPPSGIRLQ